MDHSWVYPTALGVVTAVLSWLSQQNQKKVIGQQRDVMAGQVVIHNLVNSNLSAAKEARDAAEHLADTLSLKLEERNRKIDALQRQVELLTRALGPGHDGLEHG